MTTLAERAAIIPGRSLTRSKAVFQQWASAHDKTIVTDMAGHESIDMLCGLGALSLGASYDSVLSLPHCLEVLAAEAVLEAVAPWASHVRFTVTGSEACHAAYRIAKKATGRHDVWVGDWAYHGWHEWTEQALKFPHGADVQATVNSYTAFANFDPAPAAIFIEPHRWEPVNVEWLKSVRAYCDRVGALLVFDSMIYGGRWALGGASEFFGVTPDLECYGKAFGNGLPVAFVVGNAALAEHGQIASGTYSGWVGGMNAVVSTIHTYQTEPVIATLWARGRQLQAGLQQVIPADLGVCEGQPVHQRIRFYDEAHGVKFSRAMYARGVLWHPGCANVMYAHTEAQIARVIEAAVDSVKELR